MINGIILFVVTFVQNMAFTWVSRSRNSGDPKTHAVASVFSNGIWFACNYFIIFPAIMKAFADDDIAVKLIIMAIYIAGTTAGSVVMMKINLGHFGYVPFLTEKGKSKVGER